MPTSRESKGIFVIIAARCPVHGEPVCLDRSIYQNNYEYPLYLIRVCLEALDEALSMGRPEIFNTDQGSQFTARDYTSRLEEAGIAVSRDGRGRALDNVFVERLWRSVKYEDIYIKDYERGTRARVGAEVLLLVLR